MQASKTIERTRDLILCAVFAALIAVGAFIKIPVPPVPVTLQVLFANLAVLLLGRKLGTIAPIIYLIIGLAGVPVFTQGGGIGYVLYPTFGFLLSYPIANFVGGTVAGYDPNASFKRLLAASFAQMAVIYIIGVPYGYIITHFYLGNEVGVWSMIYSWFLLFLPKEIVCAFLAAILAKRLRPVLPAFKNR